MSSHVTTRDTSRTRVWTRCRCGMLKRYIRTLVRLMLLLFLIMDVSVHEIYYHTYYTASMEMLFLATVFGLLLRCPLLWIVFWIFFVALQHVHLSAGDI